MPGLGDEIYREKSPNLLIPAQFFVEKTYLDSYREGSISAVGSQLSAVVTKETLLNIGLVLYALLGWLVGAVINHAADILPTRQTVLRRPVCLACGAARPILAWSGLLAVLTGQTHCPVCGQRHPTWLRAVVVEVIAAVIFGLVWARYGLSFHLPIISIYTAVLFLVTVTDLEHRLIFNLVMLPAILLALVAAFVTPGMAWPIALVGGGVAFVLSYLAALVSRGGLGSGDVTLSAFLGLILGFPRIFLSLGFGIFFGGLVAFLLLLTRRVTLKTYIPYGPFLTITGWLMLVWGDEIWQYYFG